MAAFPEAHLQQSIKECNSADEHKAQCAETLCSSQLVFLLEAGCLTAQPITHVYSYLNAIYRLALNLQVKMSP